MVLVKNKLVVVDIIMYREFVLSLCVLSKLLGILVHKREILQLLYECFFILVTK